MINNYLLNEKLKLLNKELGENREIIYKFIVMYDNGQKNLEFNKKLTV